MLEQNISETVGMYTGKMKLVAHDVDFCNKWKISSFLSNIQEVAGFNSTEYGCGWLALKEKYNACFVLTRMIVKMKFYPSSGQVVKLSTWPGEKPRLVFDRYFTAETEDGKVVAQAASQWVLINMDNRSLLKPTDCPFELPDTGHIQIPFKIERGNFNFEARETTERIPTYSDLDYNGHVNNARYAEWVMDLFPDVIFSGKETAEIDIRYEHEIRFGDKVKLDYSYMEETGEFFVKGYGDDKVYFRAKGIFRDEVD